MSDQMPVATISALDPALLQREPMQLLRAEAMIFMPTLQVLQTVADTSPVFTEPPTATDRGYVAEGGTTYFLPRAEVAVSRISERPQVSIAKREGAHVLTLEVVLRRNAAVAAEAELLPLSGWQVALDAPASGKRFDLTVAELPPAEGEQADVVRRLSCEIPIDPNTAITILQGEAPATFSVTAEVSYRVAAAAPPPAVSAVEGPVILARPASSALSALKAGLVHRLRPRSEVTVADLKLEAIRIHPTDVSLGDLPEAPAPESRTVRVELGPLGANFPLTNAANRFIYAAVSSDFGANPAAAWVDTPAGEFVECPVLDQFYVLPDEYRLAFDLERSCPAMSVLLVPKGSANPPPAGAPPAEGAPAAPAAPTTFGTGYGLRVRFSIVPWTRPGRLVELRRLIAQQTGIAYPQLVVGGVGAATFGLSAAFDQIGGTLVGSGEGGVVTVDPDGFELVLDCTSEFYNLLARLVATDGLTGEVDLGLLDAEGGVSRTVTRRADLRLDRPDTGFLTQQLESLDADPSSPMRVVVGNPCEVQARVSSVAPTVLAYDEHVALPVKAGEATADPTSFVLAPAAEGAATRQVLTISTTDGVPWGGVVVALDGVELDLDPQQVLSRAQELGSVTGLRSTVRLVCYQLQHPEVLPEALQDVHGLQIELRRTDAAEPVTVYLTKDQPEVTVDVAFTLNEILAGASPEQPKFSWRRRNMAGAGAGDWSEWESIIGRELFVTPVVTA